MTSPAADGQEPDLGRADRPSLAPDLAGPDLVGGPT